jgi:hypothetical protein
MQSGASTSTAPTVKSAAGSPDALKNRADVVSDCPNPRTNRTGPQITPINAQKIGWLSNHPINRPISAPEYIRTNKQLASVLAH